LLYLLINDIFFIGGIAIMMKILDAIIAVLLILLLIKITIKAVQLLLFIGIIAFIVYVFVKK
jgi:hypothetical protein